MSDWIPVEIAPTHGQRVITRDDYGREFDCGYWHWSPELKPYFKLTGYVWSHVNATHWKPFEE